MYVVVDGMLAEGEEGVERTLFCSTSCSQTLSVLVVVCSPADTLVIDQ